MTTSLESSAKLSTRMVQRTTAFARYLNMLRQFNGVGAAIHELDAAERRKIALTALAELTRAETCSGATAAVKTDWAVEAAVAFARVRSPHLHVRTTGIRGWLGAAYRATFESPYGEVQTLHRQVLRALRQMHGQSGTESPFTWLESA